MEDEWKIAMRPGRKFRHVGRVYVSVNKRGEVAMNARAYKLIGEPANVTLMYLPPAFPTRSAAIGVKFPVTADGSWFPVRRYGRDRKMRIVRGKRLLQQFEIDITQTLRFIGPAVESFKGHPMLVLPLT